MRKRPAIGPLLLLLGMALVASHSAPAPLAGQSSSEDRKVVAVLYFENHTGVERFEPLGKGLAEMLITDLSGIGSLRLVERARLQDLIDEQQLSRSDYSNPDTALEIGRVLAAEYVITGSVVGVEPEVRVDSRLIHTETAEILQTASAAGTEDRFFTIQEELSVALVEGLEIAFSDQEREEYERHRERNRIQDAETAVAYSQALDEYDRGNYVEALEKIAFVARRAPASTMVELTYERIRDDAEEAAQDEAESRVRGFLRGLIPGGDER